MSTPQSNLPPVKPDGGPVQTKRPWLIQHLFELMVIWTELCVIFLYGYLFHYRPNVTIVNVLNSPNAVISTDPFFAFIYPLYQDIHVMMFIGFGFMLTYLKNHGWNALGVNFLTAAVVIQVYILFRAFWHACFSTDWSDVGLDFRYFLTADFCVASVLITWAATVGRLGACQMFAAGVCQAFLFALNETICLWQIKAYDIGGSNTVFTFGAFFALGVGLLNPAPADDRVRQNNANSQHATIFAFIGTLFLWVFFPSFNAARVGPTNLSQDYVYGLAYGNQSHRAVINTLLSLTGSGVATYILSALFNGSRFNVEQILRSTIAGGIIIAASADLCIDPYAAILVGVWGGVWSAIGYQFIHPALKRFDTAGIFSAFLLPAIWGGAIAAVFVGGGLHDWKINVQGEAINPFNRSSNAQGGSQLIILAISLGIGLGGGILTGILVKPCKCYSPEDALYQDGPNWVQKEGLPAAAGGFASPAYGLVNSQTYGQTGFQAQPSYGQTGGFGGPR